MNLTNKTIELGQTPIKVLGTLSSKEITILIGIVLVLIFLFIIFLGIIKRIKKILN